MEAKVSRILSNSEIVLNVGEDKGVKQGQGFLIYEVGPEILDPDTNESLGNLEIHKGTVTVIDVQPRMCIAQTQKRAFQKTRVVDPWSGVLNAFSRHTETTEVTVQDKLKVDATDSDYEEKLIVRVGDSARSI